VLCCGAVALMRCLYLHCGAAVGAVRYLYEEFMSRSSTRMSLASGNYMSMMNVLMQLRKVCGCVSVTALMPSS
jgi:hypothetical protein